MRIFALVSSSILFFPFAGAAHTETKSAEPIRLGLAWNLSLDAQGHVTQMTAIPNNRSDRVPQIRERVEQEIRTWPFISGTVDGRSAPTDTFLSVTIALLPKDENSYRIVFDDVRTGGRVGKLTPPHYPASAVHERQTGMVVMRVDYDADGKTVSATLDPNSPKASKILVNASIDAVKSWTFQPERVDGHGVPGTQVLPVCYWLSSMPVRERDPGPMCAWNPPGRHAAIGEGDSLALNPAARLANDVTGHAL
jgi:TonB family protein